MKRLLLALDAGSLDLTRLDPFVRLAAELGVELDALLVEDQDLLTVAGLPFCHEVIRDSARARPLNPGQLQQASRRLSQALENRLQHLARQHPLHWQLRTHRGTWLDSPGTSWSETELLVLARPCSPLSAGIRPPVKSVALLCDSETPATRRALQLALRLAAVQRQPLLLLALPGCPYRRAADLPASSARIRIEPLAEADTAQLSGWLPAQADTLVMPQEFIWPDGVPAAHPLLELPAVQTLVVR
ncbi:MAG: hypothetical protein HWE39_06315 [Oceanospirillaceae bacterium]|nr:hypothetical protein [Oceanospirillaceae bacterium]